MKNTQELLKNIDWTELHKQKSTLLMLESTVNKDITNDLDGILGLIDAIQDYAVDEMGLTTKEVFGYVFANENETDKEIVAMISKQNETAEERFARENAETIFEIFTEHDLNVDEIYGYKMDKEFIDSIINDQKHVNIIIAEIHQAILKGVTEHPEDFERDENGKLCYDYRLFEDFGGIIDDYIKNEYESTHTRIVQLCAVWTGDINNVLICFKGDPRQ